MASFLVIPAIQTPPSCLLKASSFPTPLFSLLLQNRSPLSISHIQRLGVRCSYAEASTKEDSYSAPIDVVVNVRTERIVVLGGSGFVGSAICKAAVSKGIEVATVSRSGCPTYPGSWLDRVTWIPGDVFYLSWDEVIPGATAVVSKIGGLGSEEQIQRINGEANVVAVNAAKDYGIPKFILISVHDYNLPSFLLSSGYFTGKRTAESEVLPNIPNLVVTRNISYVFLGKLRKLPTI